MKKLLLITFGLFSLILLHAKNIEVKNIEELHKANKDAQPGDVVILQNGEWSNVSIELDCKGTAAQRIIFKAQTAGKVLITGNSRLMIGGEYITVDGLYFTKGYAGKNAVVQFRSNKKVPASYSRLTNTVIDAFNNPQRLDENNWVLFYGKHNRMDHCTIRDKQNMGVTLAVILDDDRSRENFHSIDHNYFGFRIPLGSNGGETIRVGVSQHCEFNSNTQIVHNFFEHCDGETEIVSIKSGANVISNNLFKECFGSLVLRHGNNNIVENNIFSGNGKEGSGGVRVINKGQWVVNNFFYKLTGKEFRSPLAVMNGVPNSPAHRYVAAENAVIANNTWYECRPLGFCIGSDAERSQIPQNILFLNNIVYNKGEKIYDVFDKMNGFHFAGNITNTSVTQDLANGFTKSFLKAETIQQTTIPQGGEGSKIPDSILALQAQKLTGQLSARQGFSGSKVFTSVLKNAKDDCGAKWFETPVKTNNKLTYTCKDATQLANALAETRADITIIKLTGARYEFSEPLIVRSNIIITSASKKKINFSSGMSKFPESLFEVKAGAVLTLQNLSLDLRELAFENFITTDKGGSTKHSNINLTKNVFHGFGGTFFTASKTSQLDSMIVSRNLFISQKNAIFSFMNETDKKGYYNVEKLYINNNTFHSVTGQVLTMLRGGNDESTMGPMVWFNNNTLQDCNSGASPLIYYYGTQLSYEQNNKFINSNTGGVLIQYEDMVKAEHYFKNNKVINSGKIEANKFTEVK